jgi:hypothetical protein
MRYGKMMTITVLGAFVASAPCAVQAQTTKDKVETRMEQTKDKAKSTTEDAKTAVTDSWITSKTKIALYADQRVKGTQVSVDTKDGVVHLRGKVDSDEAKQAAADGPQGGRRERQGHRQGGRVAPGQGRPAQEGRRAHRWWRRDANRRGVEHHGGRQGFRDGPPRPRREVGKERADRSSGRQVAQTWSRPAPP